MLYIAEYNPFFIKNSFNLPEHKIKYKKQVVIDYDPLFYSIFNKMNNQDITHIDYSKVNETQEKMKIAEKLDSINYKFKNKDKIKREALRGKLKELGLYQLQKSVWVYPYDFQKEVNILRTFFGLKNNEIVVMTAYEIENDRELKAFFSLE